MASEEVSAIIPGGKQWMKLGECVAIVGDINYDKITQIPDGAILACSGSIYLDEVEHLRNVTLFAGGDIFIRKLKSISGDHYALFAGGSIHVSTREST